jgi:hypothetical protein
MVGAAIVSVLLTAGIPTFVADGVERAICRIFSAGEAAQCGTEPAEAAETPGSPAPSEGPASNSGAGGGSTAGIQDPLSPNALSEYCAIDSISDSVIQQMLDDYCGARASGLDPDDAYEELLREYEALDYNREYHPERESDETITGWWMSSNPRWWNGRDSWSDDAIVAMLVANDIAETPAPGTERWEEEVDRWEENGYPADEFEWPSVQGMLQSEYQSALNTVWAENNMDSLYDVLLHAGLETGTIYEPG